MVNKIVKDLIGNTMKMYVDDMLVKSVQCTDHLQHLDKLNPKKCTFGVASGKFLGYLVTRWGIEADPDQIYAILNIRLLTCMKEVQMLNRLKPSIGSSVDPQTNTSNSSKP